MKDLVRCPICEKTEGQIMDIKNREVNNMGNPDTVYEDLKSLDLADPKILRTFGYALQTVGINMLTGMSLATLKQLVTGDVIEVEWKCKVIKRGDDDTSKGGE